MRAKEKLFILQRAELHLSLSPDECPTKCVFIVAEEIRFVPPPYNIMNYIRCCLLLLSMGGWHRTMETILTNNSSDVAFATDGHSSACLGAVSQHSNGGMG